MNFFRQFVSQLLPCMIGRDDIIWYKYEMAIYLKTQQTIQISPLRVINELSWVSSYCCICSPLVFVRLHSHYTCFGHDQGRIRVWSGPGFPIHVGVILHPDQIPMPTDAASDLQHMHCERMCWQLLNWKSTPWSHPDHLCNVCKVNTSLIRSLMKCPNRTLIHYTDVIMSMMTSQITSLMIVYSTVYSAVHQRKHQSSASLAFLRGIHWWPVNSPHWGPSNTENVSIRWLHHADSDCARNMCSVKIALCSMQYHVMQGSVIMWYNFLICLGIKFLYKYGIT